MQIKFCIIIPQKAHAYSTKLIGGIFMAARKFLAAFLVTMILFGAIIGFAVVCLSKELYMPGRFEPMLQINRIDAHGLYFTLMGERYLIRTAPVNNALEILSPWRLLLPAAPQWAALLAEEGYREVQEFRVRITEQYQEEWML